MIDIDTLVEIWKVEAITRRAEALSARIQARLEASEHGSELAWWHKAMANLCPPPPEGDVIVEDEDA